MPSPNQSGVSPEAPKVTSGQPPTGASPAPASSTSGQPALAEDPKALRQKITSQAEEIKRLRSAVDKVTGDPAVMEYLKTGKLPGSTTSAQAPEDELEAMAKTLWDEGGPENFAAALRKAVEITEARTTEKVRREFEPFVRRQISSTLGEKLRTFFGPDGKNLPEMATLDSEFTRFFADQVREKPWLKAAVDDDLDSTFEWVWSAYTKQNGDPAAEKRRQQELERRTAASLEDSTGLTPGMAGIVTQGGEKSLSEIFKELESRGL